MYFDEIIVPLSEQLRDIMTENGLSFFTQATTNGSLITEERAKKMNELGMKHFQITLDGDEKRHNDTQYERSTILQANTSRHLLSM